tara:strand:+ start:328 stop:516 length:189 start_codon:yes stop_codon:yes gene_type:complete
MANFTFNSKEYDTENISEEAKSQLVSLQFANSEVKKLEAQIAVCKTASAAYTKALQEQLENT